MRPFLNLQTREIGMSFVNELAAERERLQQLTCPRAMADSWALS
jgi:hypothetical protein